MWVAHASFSRLSKIGAPLDRIDGMEQRDSSELTFSFGTSHSKAVIRK